MFITPEQVLAHFVGDYVLQSDWMASEKTKKNLAALVHGVCYALPFVFFRPSVTAFMVIVLSHYLIDHFRLARYVCWAKNFIAPYRTLQLDSYPAQYDKWWHPWKECSLTGYHQSRPPWMAVWLLIITDNLLHIVFNAVALRWL